MDFGDILKLLFYIAIPFVISANRKAKNAKQSSRNNRQTTQTTQNNRPPAQGRTAGGGLMNRLESMIKEIEKAAVTGKPAGGTEPAVQTAKTVSSEGMDLGRETDQTSKEGREGYSMERPRRVPVTRGREARASRSEDAGALNSGDYYTSDDQSYGLFGKDDLIKGIIMSEILQPPVAKRSNKR